LADPFGDRGDQRVPVPAQGSDRYFVSPNGTTSVTIPNNPGNFANGKTGDLMKKRLTVRFSGKAKSASACPAITNAAMRAMGTPVAFETNGTVRDARGFTSST